MWFAVVGECCLDVGGDKIFFFLELIGVELTAIVLLISVISFLYYDKLILRLVACNMVSCQFSSSSLIGL